MKTIDRYILGKTLGPLFAAIGIALVAMMLERLVRLLDLLVNKGGPLFLILKMLANLIPHYLGIALPAAFFVGVLLAITRLNSDSELDAIYAFGVGLHRLLAPIMGLAVVLMVCSSIIIGFLQPHTRYAYRALVYAVTSNAWDKALERGIFFTGFGDTTIVVQDIADGGQRLSGIFIYEEKPPSRSITTTAAEGRIYRSRMDYRLILSLKSGVRLETDAAGGETSVLTFDDMAFPLDLAFDVQGFHERGTADRELTTLELWEMRNNPPPGIATTEIMTEIHGRAVRVATLLILPLFAIPLGMASRRGRRGIGLAFGLALVIFYHYVLQFGESLSDLGVVSPWVGLWSPFAVFTAVSVWSFLLARRRPGHNPISVTMDQLERAYDALRGLALRPRTAA